ncbi:hypothetical protein [Streptomyces phaeochromogenes]|uniref:hypothetical protein n=1 Tax=Streptomyces phaeochromogenes TaxID=1923 RepID=UPI002E29EF86|nr:hypothetical protein [Streptomyces phaeochromogenes]MCX4561563.1 hypothetical protein [Streptomyces phaeochromogenes]WSW21840.1 hypothetical protein OG277_37490 [Streptomyces phaeochromogenes]
MSQRNHVEPMAVARHLAKWICGLVALGVLVFVGLLAVVINHDTLIFAFKRGMLLGYAIVFTVSASGWAHLHLTGRSDRK